MYYVLRSPTVLISKLLVLPFIQYNYKSAHVEVLSYQTFGTLEVFF